MAPPAGDRQGRLGLPAGHLLVDAHNVIHAHPRLRALMRDPPAARAALALLVSERGLASVRLFCDGGPGGGPSRATLHGVMVEYSGQAEADDAIVAAIRLHGRARCTVVSDDGGLGRRARAAGARVLAAESFVAALEGAAAPAEDLRRAPPAAQEVAEWMRIFGVEEE